MAFLLFVGLFLYAFLFSGFYRVKKVEATGPDEHVNQLTQQKAEEILNQSALIFLQKKSNVLFAWLERKKIQNAVKAEIPKIDKVIVRVQGFGSIAFIVETELRKPLGVWCDKNNYCAYFDTTRVAFEEATVSTSGSWQIFDRQAEVKIGQPVTSDEDLFSKMNEARQVLEVLHTPAYTSFEIPPDTVGEFWIKTADNWPVYLDKTVDIKTQLLGLQKLMEDKTFLDKKGQIEYVDLRVNNRIYYK